jgi:hypothetical protein
MEPTSDQKALYRAFVAAYRVKFGPHPDVTDEAAWSLWRAELDQVDARHVDQIVELMGLGRDEKKTRPRLDDLKRARLSIANRFRIGGSGPVEACSHCSGTGLICVPAAPPGAHGKSWAIGEATRCVLTDTSFPCRCPEGAKRLNGVLRGASKDLCLRAWEYHLAVRKECGVGPERDISLGEFLKNPTGTSVRGLLGEVVIDSLRLDAERRGPPTTQFPGPAPAVTIKALRERKAAASVLSLVKEATPPAAASLGVPLAVVPTKAPVAAGPVLLRLEF